tara:strand:- start:26402 stop:26848 length:447 start_codon:yes stop_codon:yes gene_type:complete
MGIRGLNYNTDSRVVKNHVAAGTGTNACTPVDMQNFEGVRFVVPVTTHKNAGTVTVTFAEASATSATFNTLTGTSLSFTGTTVADSKILLADIYRPKDRYVKATVVVATQNCSFGPVVAELYGSRKLKTTNSTAYQVADTDQQSSPST